MRQVHERRSVGRGTELNFERRIARKGITYVYRLIAGESAKGVGMHHPQQDAAVGTLHHVPHKMVNAFKTTVKRILAVILVQGVSLPIQFE